MFQFNRLLYLTRGSSYKFEDFEAPPAKEASQLTTKLDRRSEIVFETGEAKSNLEPEKEVDTEVGIGVERGVRTEKRRS